MWFSRNNQHWCLSSNSYSVWIIWLRSVRCSWLAITFFLACSAGASESGAGLRRVVQGSCCMWARRGLMLVLLQHDKGQEAQEHTLARLALLCARRPRVPCWWNMELWTSPWPTSSGFGHRCDEGKSHSIWDGELGEEHGPSGRTAIKGVPERTTISDERTKPNNMWTVF
jgi:hypothetical protein